MISLRRHQRMILGIIVLLVVDIIWVTSSELTEYIFHNAKFNKPFFSTYVKTSMFLVYLSGFIFWKPWRDQCMGRKQEYSPMDVEEAVEPLELESSEETSINLGGPSFEPIKFHDGDKSSGTESDDCSKKSVRFSRLTEVRQMSEDVATDASFARMSYHASLRAQESAERYANKLSVPEVARLALVFCFLWFLGNYSYQVALSNTQAGVVNVLSSSSSLFTLLLASVFPSIPSDNFSLSKLLATLLNMSGVVLVSLSDLKLEGRVPVGALWALAGAIFYAAYLVFLRWKVDHEDKIDIPMFFGFVGLFNVALLWPGFLITHFLNIEVFEWPTRETWLFLVLNGAIGTMFSDILWLWGSFLTSSLMASLALTLTVPMSMFADATLKGVHYSITFYLGSLPMFVAALAVTLLTHYETWDPLLDGLKFLRQSIRYRRRHPRLRQEDAEQSRSLIIGSSETSDT